MDAYSRGRLFSNPVSTVDAYSRIGAYSRGRLIEALRYRNVHLYILMSIVNYVHEGEF